MPDFDVLIRNGMIFDGTGGPRYRADIGIKDGRIAAIGKLSTQGAAREIDLYFNANEICEYEPTLTPWYRASDE